MDTLKEEEQQGWTPPYPKVRVLLLFIFLVDFALQVFVVVKPDSLDCTEGHSIYEEEQDNPNVYPALLLGLGSVGFTIYLFRKILKPWSKEWVGRLYFVSAIKYLQVFADIGQMEYHTAMHKELLVVLIIIHVVESLISGVLAYYAGGNTIQRPLTTHLQLSDDERKDFVDHLDQWLAVKHYRKSLRSRIRRERLAFSLVTGLILLLCVGTWLKEFTKVLTTKKMFYPRSTLTNWNASDVIQNRTHNNTKVLLVLLDGCRYDYMDTVNEEMVAMRNSDAFKKDSLFMRMRVQLPSMSVPNWLTLLTGAPPEMTGVLGNLFVPETPFDSIFRQVHAAKMRGGITASPWMANIVASTLPFLDGRGTVATSVQSETKCVPSSDPADQLRLGVALEAIHRKGESGFELFLAHFSDIDMQGHCCGVTTKWNHDNTYNGAVTNKSKAVQQMIEQLDESWVMIVVADHGHVDRGGHGGVKSILRWVPLLIYRKNSGLATMPMNEPGFEKKEVEGYSTWNSVDIAPTISALLGLPVPRQSMGRLVKEAMALIPEPIRKQHLFDLYKQKKYLASTYITTMHRPNDTHSELTENDLNMDTASEQDLINAVEKLLTLMESERSASDAESEIRNFLLASVLDVFLLILLARVIQFHSPCDLLALLKRAKEHNSINVRALLISVFAVGGYYGIGIGTYVLLYLGTGYTVWDSTVIHTPAAIPRFVCFALVPSLICFWMVVRLTHAPHIVPPEVPEGTSRLRAQWIWLRTYIFGINPKYKDLDAVYLARHYIVVGSVLAALGMFVAQSPYTFALPSIFRNVFITDLSWKLRFHVLTVQMQSVCLFVGSMVMLYTGMPKCSTKTDTWDGVYRVRIQKSIRMRTQSVPKLLFFCCGRRQHQLLDEEESMYEPLSLERDPLIQSEHPSHTLSEMTEENHMAEAMELATLKFRKVGSVFDLAQVKKQ